mgnify:CR=1 FL=1
MTEKCKPAYYWCDTHSSSYKEDDPASGHTLPLEYCQVGFEEAVQEAVGKVLEIEPKELFELQKELSLAREVVKAAEWFLKADTLPDPLPRRNAIERIEEALLAYHKKEA